MALHHFKVFGVGPGIPFRPIIWKNAFYEKCAVLRFQYLRINFAATAQFTQITLHQLKASKLTEKNNTKQKIERKPKGKRKGKKNKA